MSTKPLKKGGPGEPNTGDEIFIPTEHPDGHWCNGIVNGMTPKYFLVAAPDHAKATLVAVTRRGYMVDWCWPADVGKKGVGAKPVSLEEIEG